LLAAPLAQREALIYGEYRRGNVPDFMRTLKPVVMTAVISGTTIEGKELTKTVAVNLGEANTDGRKRLAAAGLTLVPLGDKMQVMAAKFGSGARKSGFEEGFDIVELKVPSGRASPYWFYLPGLLLTMLVWVVQGRRLAHPGSAARAASP